MKIKHVPQTVKTDSRVRFFRLVAVCALFAAVSGVLSSCVADGGKVGKGRKVVVLGFDGLDPALLREFTARGEMPNFSRLMRLNKALELGTSNPPQSPVAWSEFITGMNPGGHGIFDFFHRDPKSFQPFFSTYRTSPPKRNITLGKWMFPLSKSRLENLRDGKPFWDVLAENGVPATVFRVPANFPPTRSKARTFSGMGTPDLLGDEGFFTFYTDDYSARPEGLTGGRVAFVTVAGDRFSAEIIGPPNTFRKGAPPVNAPFTVTLDRKRNAARISIQGHETTLKPGEWSGWIQLKFTLIPGLKTTTGIVRFHRQPRPVKPGDSNHHAARLQPRAVPPIRLLLHPRRVRKHKGAEPRTLFRLRVPRANEALP